jgi:uncharacterized protein (DUF736 family)
MKKMLFFFMVAFLFVFLLAAPAASMDNAARHKARAISVEVPITIVPDKAKVAPAFEGGEPPTFRVETDPGVSVSIMVGTNFDRLLTEKGQPIDKVFISYYGKESAGIQPAVLKADEQGLLSYTLPSPVFEAMSEGPSQIYYIAEVIEAHEGEHYDTLGVSFDYQSGKEEDAPRIAIEESPRIAEAQKHFETGQAHYLKKEFAAAAKEFNEALVFFPNPAFEYNIGLCYQMLSLQYISAAVAAGRFSTEEEEAIKEFIAAVKNSLEIEILLQRR